MINFKFPDVGEGIHEGQILKWNYDVGDKVEEGETLCVVETDKVNAEMPAPDDGILKKKGAEVGETIHVGDILAVIDDGSGEDEAEASSSKADDQDEDDEDEGEAPAEEKKSDENASVVGAIESSDEVLPASDEHTKAKDKETKSKKKALATPVARKLAKDLGVDINTIEGSGPAGRVMKEDIRKAAEGSEAKEEKAAPARTAQPAPSMPDIAKEGTRREKITRLRKSVVEAMATSNQVIPATTMMDEIDVSELAKFRREQKNLAKDQDTKLTYLPLIIKAIVLTLKEYPIFNASFDHENEEIIYKDFYNIGVAVDTPDGLIVPNIKQADKRSIFDLSREVERLASKAKDRSLQMSDLQNTTFSITNYGAFGAKLGTPIIKHPEVAILGMGAIEKKPVVVDDAIEAREMFPISLTFDHRIVDGGDGGRFMVKLKEYLQNPMLLLLS
ncbi:MAG: dihydrolipoamide acetyltransferase family protein [Candidatus Izemoplasmataceae bacterium]